MEFFLQYCEIFSGAPQTIATKSNNIMMDSGFTLPFPHQLTSKECSSSTDYTCLRCCQPLKFYSSSDDLDCAGQQTLNKLSIPIYQANKNVPINRGYEKSIHCKIMLPIELAEATSDFMFVDELGNLPLVNNQTLKVTSKLFDIMSDQSDVDHPLCEECTNNLLDQMDQQLRSAEDECKQYQEFLEKLPDDSNDENLEKLSKEFEDLLEIEAQLQKELSAIKEKDNETKQILKSVEDEYETLQREEDKQWKDLCRFERQYLNSEDNHLSFNNQLLYAQAQLDRLNKTNIFNATFHIWYNGHFGTINNFRMGRLPNVPVEWSEINAAWGQTVLLLHSLAKKMGFTFERYCLVPYGNHSYIESLENKSKDLPLYCLGGSGFMLDQRFDLAMVAFLDCLIQFKNHVELIDENYKLPYEMEKGKVKDSSSKSYSIKAQFNSEEQWTKALKFMLTNLKWALAWVSSQFQENSNL